MDYKSTLLMPKTDFDMKANLNTKEPLIQEKWESLNIYQKRLELNKDLPVYMLHDGPPYANGNIHVGHALNKTLKDIIVRYKNFAGFKAPYIPGWDTHGLPIEVALLKTDPDVKNDSIIVKRQKCKEYALKQVENQMKQFKRIGMLSDFKQKYLTLDHNFEIAQLNTFLSMVEQGLIFKDLKPVYWSWSSKTSLAEAEIEYKDIETDCIYFSVDLDDKKFENTSLIIWTTTPWTLPSNLAVAVNPLVEYSWVKTANRNYIVATSLLETVLTKKLKLEYTVLKTFKGTELEKVLYNHPIKDIKCPIILAEYVTDTDGTGLVHNAPGFGLDDYLACKKYNINIYCPIDDSGCFDASVNDAELQGMFYTDTNPIIINRLKASNHLLLHETMVHSAACDWRTKKPVMYRATPQWFVNLEKVQDKIINTLKKDVDSPVQKNTNRMIEMIQKRSEWCISRQRVWGVPIPIIYDENNQPILDPKLIKNIINILDQKGTDYWFDSDVKEFLIEDYDKSKSYTKELNIMDVWFDSGTSHNLFKIWGYDYPCDLYLEGSDQYRGWFNSSLITGTIQNNKSPYKALLQHGFVLDEKGFKMSKSLGNVVDPLDVYNKFGSDIFRLWVANSEYMDDLNIGENILTQQAEIYRKIRNSLFKYSLSILSDFEFAVNKHDVADLANLYILDRLHEVLKTVDEAYNKYQFNVVIKTIYNFVLDLSTWYFEYIKDFIYCYKENDPIRREAQTVVYVILKNLTLALAPIMPHTTDEVYSFINSKTKKESIHLENWIQLTPFITPLNNNIKAEIAEFFNIRTTILTKLEELRNNKVIKKNNEAKIYLPKAIAHKIPNINLKAWMLVADVEVDNNIKEIKVENANYCKCERCWSYFKPEDMHDDICSTCFENIK